MWRVEERHDGARSGRTGSGGVSHGQVGQGLARCGSVVCGSALAGQGGVVFALVWQGRPASWILRVRLPQRRLRVRHGTLW